MTNEEYHAHPAIGASDIKLFVDDPWKFHLKKNKGIVKPDTPSLRLGSYVHCKAVPGQFADEFAISPKVDKRTKEGKKLYAIWQLEHGDKTEITANQYADASAMIESIRESEEAQKYLNIENRVCEESFFWEEAGREFKCRPDIMGDIECVDIKTTKAPALENFIWEIKKYKYDLQAAHYLRGTGRLNFIMIAVGNTPPYSCYVYDLSPSTIKDAMDNLKETYQDIAARYESGEWRHAEYYRKTTLTL